jgi:hypothetical protein
MDAKANHRFNIVAWPTEGASLVEAIERISGPKLLTECRTARDAVPPHTGTDEKNPPLPIWWLDNSGDYKKRGTAGTFVKRAMELTRACLAPIIDAWDAGEIRATGKRSDVLAAAVEIPTPAHLFVVSVADLERSIIIDPSGGQIFDLRFHVGPPRPPMAPKRWLEVAVTELKRAGNAPEKPTDFARVLRTRMIADADRGKVKDVWAVRTIENRLRDYGLWP